MKTTDANSLPAKHYLDAVLSRQKGQFNNKNVIISNELARQSLNIPLEIEKLLHCVLSQYSKDIDNQEIQIKKADLFEILGLKGNNRYRDTLIQLKRMIHYTIVDARIHGKDIIAPVFIKVESVPQSEFIEVTLNPSFMPHMRDFVSLFTVLNLESIVRFHSKYSLMLYKHLASWRGAHYATFQEITTKELKEVLGLTKNDYVRSTGKFDRSSFERYAVKVAVKEINEKVPGWEVTWGKIKKGNRVQAYYFHWEDKNRITTHNTEVDDDQIALDLAFIEENDKQ